MPAKSKTKSRVPKKKLVQITLARPLPIHLQPSPPAITEVKDAQGHIVSASCKLQTGITIGVQFPPFPYSSNLTFTMDGKPTINSRIDFQTSTLSITIKIGNKTMVATILSTVPPWYPPFKLSMGPAIVTDPQFPYKLPEDVLTSMNQAFTDFARANSYGIGDLNAFTIFRDTIKAAFLSINPTGVASIFQPYLPQTGPVALKITVWGSIARGVIWGLAGLGTAALLAGSAPITLTTGIIVFAAGYDASVYSDVVSIIESNSDDDGGGNNTGPATTTAGGNNPTPLPIDQTTTNQNKKKPNPDTKFVKPRKKS